MKIDERGLNELIVESQDLQVDAMLQVKGTLPDFADIAAESRGAEVDPEEVAHFNLSRRNLLRRIGLGAGGAAAGSILGPSIFSLLAQPAAADQNLDVQILQTASSIERLAVDTYAAALTLPFIKAGNQVVVKFAQTTMSQHDEHLKGFQAQTTNLGGKVQNTPNTKYTPVVEAAKPTLKTPADVVKLAATLEQVARDTYLSDLAMFADKTALSLMASVMGVETQHLATLRAVEALLAGNAPELIAIPVDASKLPAAAGSVGFPQAIPTPDKASPPSEGAVK